MNSAREHAWRLGWLLRYQAEKGLPLTPLRIRMARRPDGVPQGLVCGPDGPAIGLAFPPQGILELDLSGLEDEVRRELWP